MGRDLSASSPESLKAHEYAGARGWGPAAALCTLPCCRSPHASCTCGRRISCNGSRSQAGGGGGPPVRHWPLVRRGRGGSDGGQRGPSMGWGGVGALGGGGRTCKDLSSSPLPNQSGNSALVHGMICSPPSPRLLPPQSMWLRSPTSPPMTLPFTSYSQTPP
jgi:hypothetical protein